MTILILSLRTIILYSRYADKTREQVASSPPFLRLKFVEARTSRNERRFCGHVLACKFTHVRGKVTRKEAETNIRAARFRGKNLHRGCTGNSMASPSLHLQPVSSFFFFLLSSHIERNMCGYIRPGRTSPRTNVGNRAEGRGEKVESSVPPLPYPLPLRVFNRLFFIYPVINRNGSLREGKKRRFCLSFPIKIYPFLCFLNFGCDAIASSCRYLKLFVRKVSR